MNNPTNMKVAEIAGKLTKAQREAVIASDATNIRRTDKDCTPAVGRALRRRRLMAVRDPQEPWNGYLLTPLGLAVRQFLLSQGSST